mmetsp:Transcript_3691/g.14445  ORF Transcript_3691/g.14445 Transcript_3691/m.14445 type:complete len:304 (-) Transcript_3691:553-1464(-)
MRSAAAIAAVFCRGASAASLSATSGPLQLLVSVPTSSKKASWRSVTTSSAQSSSMTRATATLEAPCEIISTCLSRLSSAAKAKATRCVDSRLMLLPTSETMARFRRTWTWAKLSRSRTAAGGTVVFLSSVSDTETSEVATTSTETPCRSSVLNTAARKPDWPTERSDTTSTSVMSRFEVMAVTRHCFERHESSLDEMSVPGWSGLYEFLMRTGSPARSAGCIDTGWSSCAPKYASSAASSYVANGTGTALRTTRGSADIMPSTSFQTWTSWQSLRAAPSAVAVRSEPPRPSVTTRPSRCSARL